MIYIVRHGQTEWNVLGKVQGKQDICLNEKGREQALLTKKYLDNKEIDLIIVSPLKRALETAEIINKDRNIPMIVDNRIKERDFGEFEGQEFTLLDTKPFWDYYINEEYKEAESVQEFFKRVYDFLDDIIIKYKDKNVLIVAHGGVSLPVHCYFNKNIPEGSLLKANIMLDNCQVKEFE